jgi:four helix bundle protein
MSSIKNFEELEIWQEAREIAKWVLTLKQKLQSNYYLRLYSQIVESSGSIMDNIAEGFERSGNKEFIHFLFIAKASAGETRSQLYRLLDAEIIDQNTFDAKYQTLIHISGKINALVKHLKESEIKGWRFKEPAAEYE